MQTPQPDKPDVESIIAKLKSDREAASDAVSPDVRTAREDEDRLHENLAAANRSAALGDSATGWRKLFAKPLSPVFGRIQQFNTHTVKVLNRLVRLLEGEELPEAGPILDAQKRRLTLTGKLEERVRDLEARVRELEENAKR